MIEERMWCKVHKGFGRSTRSGSKICDECLGESQSSSRSDTLDYFAKSLKVDSLEAKVTSQERINAFLSKALRSKGFEVIGRGCKTCNGHGLLADILCSDCVGTGYAVRAAAAAEDIGRPVRPANVVIIEATGEARPVTDQD